MNLCVMNSSEKTRTNKKEATMKQPPNTESNRYDMARCLNTDSLYHNKSIFNIFLINRGIMANIKSISSSCSNKHLNKGYRYGIIKYKQRF